MFTVNLKIPIYVTTNLRRRVGPLHHLLNKFNVLISPETLNLVKVIIVTWLVHFTRSRVLHCFQFNSMPLSRFKAYEGIILNLVAPLNIWFERVGKRPQNSFSSARLLVIDFSSFISGCLNDNPKETSFDLTQKHRLEIIKYANEFIKIIKF